MTNSNPILDLRRVAAGLAVATVMIAGAHVPNASAASCSIPKYPGQGYFTSLSVTGTGCATGRKVALSYYKCRIKKGKKGTCKSKVLGYRCSEKRSTIPTEINARVTCKRGKATVVHTYQQNT
jgi:hypothetical protein